MSKCELYKDTHITIRTDNGNIYYGPIKSMYTTFNDYIIDVFYNGVWYPASIIGIASEKKMVKINDTLICSKDLLVKQNGTTKAICELIIGDIIEFNQYQIKNIIDFPLGEEQIKSIKNTDIMSEWLFGVEFKDATNKYYTLSNGIIISN